MSFTPFSIVLTAIIGWLLFGARKLRLDEAVYKFFVLKLILDLTLDYGYFIKIGESTISYSGIVSIILFVLSLFSMRKMDMKVLKNGLVFVFLLLLGIITGMLFPYDHRIVSVLNGWDRTLQGNYVKNEVSIGFYNLSFLFTAIRFVVILATLRTLLVDRNKVFDLVRKVLSFSTLNIVYGYVEAILKNLFKFDVSANILSPIFGVTESTYSRLSLRGTLYSLQGLCKEPSYYSNTLFVFALLSIAYIYYARHSDILKKNIIVKKEIIRIAALSVLLIFGFSFSSVVYLAFIVVAFFVVVLGQRKVNFISTRLIQSVPLVLIIGILLLSLKSDGSLEYYATRFKQLGKTISQIISSGTVGAFNSSSEAVRLTSIIESFRYFLNRPLLGLGIGATDCHSFIVSILSNCGLLGLLLWSKTIMAFSRTTMKNKKFIIFLFVILCIIGSFGDTFSFYYPVLILTYNCLYIAHANDKSKRISASK